MVALLAAADAFHVHTRRDTENCYYVEVNDPEQRDVSVSLQTISDFNKPSKLDIVVRFPWAVVGVWGLMAWG